MSVLSDILKIIDAAPADFSNKMPEIEKKVFGQISLLLKDLKTDSAGKIVPNLENLQLINTIKSKLAKIVVSKEYAAAVEKFVGNIPAISNFQTGTAGLGAEGKKMISTIAKQQINNTLEGLLGAGYTQEVVSKLNNLLLTNVTSGGNYNDLLDTLRAQLVSTETSPGMLSKYAKTYANDALGQFAGQGNKIIADTLNSEWFAYEGSNLTTTREFCEHLTKKRWVHKSEIPELLKGHIDGHKCAIYDKTGLPLGMIDGTTPDNFIVNRGGYNCGHELIPVSEVRVPKEVRERFTKKQTIETEGLLNSSDDLDIRAKQWASALKDPDSRKVAEEAAKHVLHMRIDLPKIEERNLGGRTKRGLQVAQYYENVNTIFVNTNPIIKKSGGMLAMGKKSVESGFLSQENHILHELGHYIHSKTDGNFSIAKNHQLPFDKEFVSGTLSRYGSSSYLEYEAELISGILAGKKYSPTLLQSSVVGQYKDTNETAKELYKMGVASSNTKEIRKWAKESIQGTAITHSVFGKAIQISGRGIREFTNQPHKYFFEKNGLLKDLQGTFNKATYKGVSTWKGRKSHIFEINLMGEKNYIIANEYAGKVFLYSITDSNKVLIDIKMP
ncbi:MAG: hypothetical protein LBS01_06275 [Prevotellaceae bacterium]|jgi:hypothetical protein|nr:hypothetical protein [Prevotellaceae bacterium]